METQKKRKKMFVYLIAILINALGNSFMIVATIGSAPWTAASEALSEVTPFSIGISVVILHTIALLIALSLGSKFRLWTIAESFLLAVLFGLAIDAFIYLHETLYLPISLVERIVYFLIGVPLISLGLSLYLQIGYILMPPDYLMKSLITTFNKTSIGATISLAIPFLLACLLSLFEHEWIGIGFGTVFFLIVNGPLIDRFQRMFPIQG